LPQLSDPKTSGWHVLGASVRGAAHIRAGLANQDAMQVELADGCKLPAILAVSDGHGSAKCFRSDIGSQLAVKVAAEVLREFAAASAIGEMPAGQIEQLAVGLPGQIVSLWRDAIGKHWQANPITDQEWSAMDPDVQTKVRQTLESGKPFIAYGATLVSAMLGRNYMVSLQLGDGEILAATRDRAAGDSVAGNAVTADVQQPIAADPALIANETTSLCQDDAERNFRVRVQQGGAPPALILLATDGYPNSFATPEGFRQVASDLLAMLDQEGFEPIAQALPGWLEEASQQGSGDDVSVAILYAPRFTLETMPP
jgi:serine/threonine protein phosphatase PrpC